MFLSDLFAQTSDALVAIKDIISCIPTEILLLGVAIFGTFLLVSGLHMFSKG